MQFVRVADCYYFAILYWIYHSTVRHPEEVNLKLTNNFPAAFFLGLFPQFFKLSKITIIVTPLFYSAFLSERHLHVEKQQLANSYYRILRASAKCRYWATIREKEHRLISTESWNIKWTVRPPDIILVSKQRERTNALDADGDGCGNLEKKVLFTNNLTSRSLFPTNWQPFAFIRATCLITADN